MPSLFKAAFGPKAPTDKYQLILSKSLQLFKRDLDRANQLFDEMEFVSDAAQFEEWGEKYTAWQQDSIESNAVRMTLYENRPQDKRLRHLHDVFVGHMGYSNQYLMHRFNFMIRTATGNDIGAAQALREVRKLQEQVEFGERVLRENIGKLKSQYPGLIESLELPAWVLKI